MRDDVFKLSVVEGFDDPGMIGGSWLGIAIGDVVLHHERDVGPILLVVRTEGYGGQVLELSTPDDHAFEPDVFYRFHEDFWEILGR